MSGRWRWLIPLLIGILILAGIGFWGYQQYTVRRQLEVALNNKYQRAFYDTVNSVKQVEVLLSKTLVAGAPEQDVNLLGSLWQEANSAQANLNQLPVADLITGRTAKFLSQVGDYSHTLLQQIAEGRKITEKQWDLLRGMYRQTSSLSTDLQKIERKVADGRLSMSEIKKETARHRGDKPPAARGVGFRDLEDELQEFPSVIYDGPFSDHLARKKPKGLTGGQITRSEAGDVARRFIARQNKMVYKVVSITTENGKIPSYRVEMTGNRPDEQNQPEESISLGISRKGGHVLWLANSRLIDKPTIGVGEAVEKARQFLAKRGFKEVVSTYYEQMSGLAVCNFAATQEGIVMYPDLLKVGVALDNGEIVGFESTGYFMAHHKRDLPVPKLTSSRASQKLNPDLKDVQGGRLAVIPVGVEKEQMVYEFMAQSGGDTFLIYIDAMTGKEVGVTRVIRNNEGIIAF